MSARKRLPKEVQSMVDGGFNLLNIIVAIVATVRELAKKLGQTDQQWTGAVHQLSQPEGADKIRAIAELIIGEKTIAVVQRTWQDLLNACQQFLIDHDFTEARWPLEQVAADEAEWEVGEYFFEDNATGEEKLRRLAEMVKRAEIRICGVRRAMVDTADHLDIQLGHPRIVPVSAQHSGGSLCLPVFYHYWSGRRQRELSLYDVSKQFDSRCGWLVLRKRP